MVHVIEAQVDGDRPVAINPGVVRPLDAGGTASIRRLTAVDTLVDLVDLPPHRFDTPASGARNPPALLLIAVLSGRLEGELAGTRFDVGRGGAVLMDTRQPLHTVVDGPIRMLRILVDRRRIPARALGGRPVAEVLADSPVLHGCTAAAEAVLRHSGPGSVQDDDRAVAELLTGLQRSLLAESTRQRADRGDLALLTRRERIDRYITAHLDDRSLSPRTIAAAFDLSLRTVHAAYTDGDETIGRSIRRRRIELVQAELRCADALPDSDELAAAYGFEDGGHLVRSFRAATGRSLRDWFERPHLPSSDRDPARPPRDEATPTGID